MHNGLACGCRHDKSPLPSPSRFPNGPQTDSSGCLKRTPKQTPSLVCSLACSLLIGTGAAAEEPDAETHAASAQTRHHPQRRLRPFPVEALAYAMAHRPRCKRSRRRWKWRSAAQRGPVQWLTCQRHRADLWRNDEQPAPRCFLPCARWICLALGYRDLTDHSGSCRDPSIDASGIGLGRCLTLDECRTQTAVAEQEAIMASPIVRIWSGWKWAESSAYYAVLAASGRARNH